ncbi:tRNA uridine-5-carboxymethylaminomethyl(34) synthesis GTPase MnmE [Clostridium sp. 'deep sea']|uniref:tRNA uridine-5-carboxymethylaminomethyl(34) synthesis GTPase MnmE n=1 Tax=Clostridium sp. 'deep sea' TaxID=2779445 RepID=UPI0018964DB1|nr:tRNA uridine-5-carboxymethylaminomethyl(34) synthesis GTPase MnmE [Clostridium sp. 'deep sea']QOR34109.1 tRNA uridine-5-carboxymethylaminomethyl(34) synthesis GTPase MnmE [Clostridium sp. 'deep sea']
MDTIVAIATAMGEGGIGIIRLSGPEAVYVTDKIFVHVKGKKLINLDSHKIYYGNIIDKENRIIDEVLVSLMRAPLTYTKEDVVEINCHGGIQPLNQILQLLLAQPNIRLAEAGEFTKRAFLNGRIDLAQAESVIDIIRSKTDSALRVSMGQLQGILSKKVNELYDNLLELQAEISLNIDYPEYDEYESSKSNVQEKLKNISKKIDLLLHNSKLGRIVREGIKTAIVGRPNVGKSSLLNALLGEDRAIVTDIPGTTRDTVEESLNLGGIPLHVVDTAGIRDSNNIVEKIGIERSRKALISADLVLLVIDVSHNLTVEDLELLNNVPNDRTILILNKNDLQKVITEEEIKKYKLPIVELSALKGVGIKGLEELVKKMFMTGKIESNNTALVSNVRHIDLLKKACQDIEQALTALHDNMPIDLVNIDIQNARENIGSITGKTVHEELLDFIFAEFCVGK